MSLRPYKFIIKAVPQVIDGDGEVVGEEHNVQPVEFIGGERAIQWLQEFPTKLAQADAARSESPPIAER